MPRVPKYKEQQTNILSLIFYSINEGSTGAADAT